MGGGATRPMCGPFRPLPICFRVPRPHRWGFLQRPTNVRLSSSKSKLVSQRHLIPRTRVYFRAPRTCLPHQTRKGPRVSLSSCLLRSGSLLPPTDFRVHPIGSSIPASVFYDLVAAISGSYDDSLQVDSTVYFSSTTVHSPSRSRACPSSSDS